MTEPDDPELIRSPDERTPAPPRTTPGPWPLVVILAIVMAVLVGGYLLLRPGSPVESSPAAIETPTPAPASEPTPLGGSPFPAEVPPLEASDTFVRTWLPRLSAHPRVAAWLTTDGLIRNFVTVVSNIAEGTTPAGRLAVLRPAGPFRVVERGDRLFVDDRSHTRYDDLAEAFVSVEPSAAAQLYATLKPRIIEAHAELGARDSFDATLERAIVQLLDTPVHDGALQVEPSGIGYRATSPRLDALTGAQKQLLRMGPANARRVQAHLRRIALALGVPESRLPAP